MKIVSVSLALIVASCIAAHAATPKEIAANNARSIVYLQVEDAQGGVLNRGSGFIVSHDGYVVTAAHLKVEPGERMRAFVGQRDGTSYVLHPRATDHETDVALWQLPQSLSCRPAVTLSTKPIAALDLALVLGFPGEDGLTPAAINISNTISPLGFYEADGDLRPGNSGGPVFNEEGKVVAIVEGGVISGAKNNNLIPIAAAIALINKRGVSAALNTPLAYAPTCYATCRDESHGVERWLSVVPWKANTGWKGGGHTSAAECDTLKAAALIETYGARIELLPGEGAPETTGMWEKSEKNILGRVEYKYFCKGHLKSNPVYVDKQSAACGLWQ